MIFAKLATTLPVEHPTTRALFSLQREIERTLDGRFHIQLFPDAQLGNAEQILHGVQFGSIEMGVAPSELLVSYSPVFAAVSMPYIFRDQTHRFHVLDGPVGMRLLNSLTRYNMIGLGFLETGMRNILSRHAHFDTPQAYEGKKIGIIRRCPQACPSAVFDLVEHGLLALGARPEVLAMKDAATALETDTVSGVECELEEMLSLDLSNCDELYWNEGMFYSVPDVLVVSQSWFDSLSPQMQEMLWNVSRLAVNQQREYWTEQGETMMKTLEAQGITRKKEETALFREAVQDVRKHAFETFGEEFAAAIRSILSVK